MNLLRLRTTFPISIQFYDFKNADFVGFSGFFADIQWDVILSECANVDEATDLFYDKSSEGLERFVPVLTKKRTSHPPWYTRTVINLKNRKNRPHKKLSRPHSFSDEVKYYSLNKEFLRKQNLAYESYLHDVENGLTGNPRNFCILKTRKLLNLKEFAICLVNSSSQSTFLMSSQYQPLVSTRLPIFAVTHYLNQRFVKPF